MRFICIGNVQHIVLLHPKLSSSNDRCGKMLALMMGQNLDCQIFHCNDSIKLFFRHYYKLKLKAHFKFRTLGDQILVIFESLCVFERTRYSPVSVSILSSVGK